MLKVFNFTTLTEELKTGTGIQYVLRQTISKQEYSTQHSLFAQIINQDFFWSTKLGAGLLVINCRVLQHVSSCLVATGLFSKIA